MTQKYDWDSIRVRYEAGENSYVISRSYGGSPTRQRITKRAKREGWLSILPDTMQAVRNLPSVQEPSFQRATSDELGKRSAGNARLLLAAFERGAPPKLASGLVGLTQGQLKTWMGEDPQFAMEIMSRTAQAAAENLRGVWDAEDWKACKWLLERNPFSQEEFGPQRTEKAQPTIILNIHRDEVVIEQVAQPTKVAQPHLESIAHQEPVEEFQSTAEPSANWQGDDIIEKKAVNEQQALEQRVMGSQKKH